MLQKILTNYPTDVTWTTLMMFLFPFKKFEKMCYFTTFQNIILNFLPCYLL